MGPAVESALRQLPPGRRPSWRGSAGPPNGRTPRAWRCGWNPSGGTHSQRAHARGGGPVHLGWTRENGGIRFWVSSPGAIAPQSVPVFSALFHQLHQHPRPASACRGRTARRPAGRPMRYRSSDDNRAVFSFTLRAAPGASQRNRGREGALTRRTLAHSPAHVRARLYSPRRKQKRQAHQSEPGVLTAGCHQHGGPALPTGLNSAPEGSTALRPLNRAIRRTLAGGRLIVFVVGLRAGRAVAAVLVCCEPDWPWSCRIGCCRQNGLGLARAGALLARTRRRGFVGRSLPRLRLAAGFVGARANADNWPAC
jgi:hypothetical protein